MSRPLLDASLVEGDVPEERQCIFAAEELLAEVAALEPRDYIDTKVPLESAGFTSTAWQAVSAKRPSQAALVLVGFGYSAMSIARNVQDDCTGFDGSPHPEYVWTSSWRLWADWVFPFSSTMLHVASATLYCVCKGRPGAVLRLAVRIPIMCCLVWFLAVIPWMATQLHLKAGGMTMQEQERTCLVSMPGGMTGITPGEGAQFHGETFLLSRVLMAIGYSMFLALTYSGRFGFMLSMWFCAVFGLPCAAVAAWLAISNEWGMGIFWSAFCVLLFLFCTRILVKRHGLLKRTTAGLLKDKLA